jgi:hypothetical protein
MKNWIVSGSFIAISLLAYYYYTISESNNATIATQKELIKTKTEQIKELEARIKFEQKTIAEQKTALDAYNSRVQEIKIVEKPVIVYKELIKTETEEVIVETANEDTNEIISSINASSTNFSGVHNN